MKTYQIPPGGTVYMFQAAFRCKECGETLRRALDAAGAAPTEPDDETTYDSGDYPKGPYPAEQEETCDSMDRCLSLLQEGAQ